MVSAVFVWLVLGHVDLGVVGATLAASDPGYLAPTVALLFLTYLLRSWRWRLCFDVSDELNFRTAAAAYGAGVASTQAIPGRLGDLVRVYALGRWSRVDGSKAIGTLVVERLSDLLGVVLMLAIILPFISAPVWVTAAETTAVAAGVLVFAAVFLLARGHSSISEPEWIQKVGLLRRCFAVLMRLLSGFQAVRSLRRIGSILLLTFGVWLLNAGYYAASFRAVHLNLGLGEGALLTGVLALSTILPAGPGYVGNLEAAAVATLGLFAVDQSVAVAYLEYTRATGLLTIILFAAIGFGWLRMSRGGRRLSPAAANASLAQRSVALPPEPPILETDAAQGL